MRRSFSVCWAPSVPAVLLVLLVLVAYSRTFGAHFVWDDDSHLTANPAIVGAGGLRAIWTSASANYFPLTLTTFWLEHALWGLRPAPYHVVNVLMHAACAVLLWRVLLRLFERGPSRLSSPEAPPARRSLGEGGWLGAALWALHPVQVDSVAWISEMKNTQAGMFFLLAVWIFLRWLEREPPKMASAEYGALLVCALAAMLSKSSTVMLPVALLLCARWQTGAWRARFVTWLAPLFALSAVASGWTIWEQKYHSLALGAEWNLGALERCAVAGRAIWFYLGKLLWPESLMFVYPRWSVPASIAGTLPFLAAIAALVALAGTRKTHSAFFAAAFFAALIFPALGFFNVYYFRYAYVADHFQHLASIGPLALAGAGLAWLGNRVGALKVALPAAVVLTLGILTWRETATYHDSATLWRTTYARNPDAWIAATILGNDATNAGRLEEGLRLQDAALRTGSGAFEVHYNRGLALKKIGRIDEAIAEYQRALQLNPGLSDAEHNLAIALVAQNRSADAIAHFERALRITNDQPETHLHLAIALTVTGRAGEAIPHYEQALRLKPDYADAHYAFARTLHAAGRIDDALPHYREAVRLKPDFADAHYHYAIALRAAGRENESAAEIAEARRLRPDLPDSLK